MFSTIEFRRTARLVLASAFIAILASSAAPTAGAKETGAFWHKACAKEKGRTDCFIEQFTIVRNHGRNLVVLGTRMDFDGTGKNKARILLTAPLGVLLPAGLHLAMDGGKAFALPFDRCNPHGCTAVAALNRSALLKLERGKTLMVRYVVTSKVAPVMPVRLRGLTAALRSLRK